MTTETKFTPGPWSVDRNVIRGDADQFGRTVAIASTLNVAWPYGRRATKEEPYNAHLIAAAPELYEALDQLLAVKECCDETGYVDGEGFVDVEAVMDKARAALAKARGES